MPKRTTISFKDWVADRLYAYCDRHMLPLSLAVNQMITEWLDDHEPTTPAPLPPPMPEKQQQHEIDDFTKTILEASDRATSADLLKIANKDQKP